jgi:hypothetical protein
MSTNQEISKNHEPLASTGDSQGNEATGILQGSASPSGGTHQPTGEEDVSRFRLKAGWYYEKSGRPVRSYACDGWQI